MLKITARIFDDNQLVGYLLTDGKAEKPVTREQAWKYAKNKMIENVVAVGSANVQTPFGASNSASLSGKNGFELKSLPKIEEVCNSNEIYEMKEELRDNGAGYTIEERELLIRVLIKIRKAMDKPKLDAMKNAIREAVYNESDKFRSMSQYITVVAILYDSKCEEIDKMVRPNAEQKRAIIGYRIKYTGEKSLFIQRKPKAEDSIPCVTELKTNEECNLNFMETTELAAKPEFSFKFANGKIIATARKTRTLEEQLESYRVSFDNTVPEIDIRTCDTEENINITFDTMATFRSMTKELKSKNIANMDYGARYILKIEGFDIKTEADKNRVIEYLEEVLGEKKANPADAVAKAYVEKLLAKTNGTEKKLKQANSPKGIFDAFKR